MDEKQLAELEHLKKTLRCLVISSATVTDVQSLSRDFYSMEGERIPHLKFGYPSLLPFLKERFNDSLLFSGDPKNPIVTPVITERTKHINDMVAKQKIPSTAKVKIKRSSVLESAVTPNRWANNEQNKTSYSKGSNKFWSSGFSRSSMEVGLDNWRTKPGEQINTQSIKWPELPKRQILKHNATSEINGKGAIPKVNGQQISKPKKPVAYTSVESNDCLSKPMEKLNVNSKYNALYLNKTKSQLQELLHYNPLGIWLDDLNKLYCEKFEDTINCSRIGYSDVESLCRDLSDVVRLERSSYPEKLILLRADHEGPNIDTPNVLKTNLNHDGPELSKENIDYKGQKLCKEEVEHYDRPEKHSDGHKILHDVEHFEGAKVSCERSKDRRQEAPTPIRGTREVKSYVRRQQELDLSGDSDDALPGVPYDDGIFPEDCMGHKASISPVCAMELEIGHIYEINVSEVLDPSHFWFQLRSEQHDLALETLMDEMTQYYEKGEGRTRVMESGAVQVGQYCASNYEPDGWHRCVIVRIIDTDYVQVRQVDYGTVARVARSGLRVLLHKWAWLPAQALRGCLANIRPAAGLSYWPYKTSLRYLELVNCVPLIAQVHSIEAHNQIIRLYLTDTTKEEDIFLNNVLVTDGHAEVCDMHRDVSPPPSITLCGTREAPPDVWTLASSYSDLSESASAIVDRPPKRMKEWEPPDEAARRLGLKRLLLVQELMSKLKLIQSSTELL